MNCELCNLGKNAASTMLLWYIGLNLFGAAIANEQEVNITKYAIVGRNISITCVSTEDRPIWWTINDKNITTTNKRINIKVDNSESPIIVSNLTITKVELADNGNYTCNISTISLTESSSGSNQYKPRRFNVFTTILPRVTASSSSAITTKISQTVHLFCTFEAHPLDDFLPTIKWTKLGENGQKGASGNTASIIESSISLNQSNIQKIDDKHVNVTLSLIDIFKKDNGTYTCSMETPFISDDVDKYFVSHRMATKSISVLVLDAPQVSLDYVQAVGASKIFVNWTVNDGNAPVKQYFVQYQKEGVATYTYYNHAIDGKNLSYVLENFDPDSVYHLKIAAQNSINMGPTYTYPLSIRTLDKDPVFIPEIGVKGNTHTTITIGWQAPPPNLLDYIQYYELQVSESGNNASVIEEAIHPQNNRNLPYMFDNLRTATEYKFKARACSELTKLCGNWSETAVGTTMDGTSSAPLNIQVECHYSNISGRTTVSAQWEPPLHRNGKITTYHIVLDGLATFRSEKGNLRNETYGPKVKSVDEKLQKAEYENVPLNTNYTIHVSGVTRSKRPGDFASASCQMPKTTPDIGPILWGKVKTETNHWIMKLFLPRISERFGPICGYRIYLIRLPPVVLDKGHKHMPPIEELPISTYEFVHASNNTNGGAYIAEIVPYDDYQPEVILGDGHTMRNGFADENDLLRNVQNDECRKLLRGYYAEQVKASKKDDFPEGSAEGDIISPAAKNSTQPEILTVRDSAVTEASIAGNPRIVRSRSKRQHTTNSIQIEQYENGKTTTTTGPASVVEGSDVAPLDERRFKITDGYLDPSSNYTGFVEVIVNIDDEKKTVSAYSEYFDVMSGGALNDTNSEAHLSKILNIVTQVLCGLILLVLVLLTALCILHKFHTGKQQGTDVISLRDSLSRALCGGRNGANHRHLLGTMHAKPADIGPINRTDLSQAYVQRHRDTDYGFLREYEMLPTRFNDRTTKATDAKENSNKNRYPDIKAYDQTRVRLSERITNGFTSGSDYVNANFVLGYKERKKFICAQGPMDSTINDFWRMIWEQHLEIIVMLTNLEEYNKAKCAKYWPEQISDVTKFGEITVTFMREQRFSDYLVRELKITRRISSQANNSNNSTIANGGNGTVNAPSSGGSEDEEERRITQYHYLAWKDFMAPELGVIKFIRQINDVYSVQRGPILVHCSAGVGRTGTLVALDSLMQQLQDENQVSIFNTVCDLRHQRNFLVQSLKQYIFLYRALLDVSQFGNTEIQFKDINATIDQLKTRPGDGQCKLEQEFEKIKAILDESNKNAASGNLEENRSKNRSEDVIPFDRNRVILTPIGRDNSTYINATFIEGYDNTESFIITQDPLEDTIADFWRMISEQGITTIVMISEIGDGPRKCPRYWADDEVQYEHILVKYLQSESCPYYTRREFNVTNFKMKDTIKVTQFQYNGWPTVEGEVPEVARGMIELVDQAQTFHNSQAFAEAGPIVVHCSFGTDRSSIFVTLSILVQQLRTEKKIDACTIVRKLRSQRPLFMSSYAQYEFVHRAIASYADLHKLDLESSPTPSVRTNS